jgi:hypothetical protein
LVEVPKDLTPIAVAKQAGDLLLRKKLGAEPANARNKNLARQSFATVATSNS